MKTCIINFLSVLAILFLLASTAQATAILVLEFNSLQRYTIYDNSYFDNDPLIGVIHVNGEHYFPHSNIDVIGYSKPYSDSSNYPRMFDTMTLESNFLFWTGNVQSILTYFYDSSFGNHEYRYAILFNSTYKMLSNPDIITDDSIYVSVDKAYIDTAITTETLFSASNTFKHGHFNINSTFCLCNDDNIGGCEFDNTKYYGMSVYYSIDSGHHNWGQYNLKYKYEIGPTPEPSTFLLFGAGLGSMALLRRRKR